MHAQQLLPQPQLIVHPGFDPTRLQRGYNALANVDTLESAMTETGIRELRNHLSQYLDRVRNGEELVVTDRGTAVARIVPMTQPRRFDRLVRDGLIERAPETARQRPRRRASTSGPVSDLVAAQRR